MPNIFSFLQNSAAGHPDKACIIDMEQTRSYKMVLDSAVRLAQTLRTISPDRGDRILIFLDNSFEYVAALFSVFSINAVAVPINKNTTEASLQHIVDETSPKAIISNEMIMRNFVSNLRLSDCKIVYVDQIMSAAKSAQGAMNNEAIVETEFAEDEEDAQAMILYTSGTTSKPKGVVLTHENLLANSESILQYLKLTPEDSVLATISFSYSYGNSVLLTHIKIGGMIVIENRSSYPVVILEKLKNSKVTGFSTLGSYLARLLSQEVLETEHFQNLRYITLAGERTDYTDIEKLSILAPHIEIFNMYGQTEASARLSYLEPSLLFSKRGSIGKGIPGVTLRVVTEEGRDVIVGETGQVIASGRNIMKCYWNNEAETRSAIRDGWLYTGDLAVVDEDGYIYLKGRKDDIIKYMGHRISPAEIEAVINECEVVTETAVVGMDVGGAVRINAYVVPREISSEADAIQRYREIVQLHIRKNLPPVKRPHSIEFLDMLPRTSNGKLKRSELKNQFSKE